MRVLFCRSNPIDPDPRVEKEAAALSSAGYSVSIIAWDRTGSLPRKETRDQITIHRLPIKADYAQGLGNLPALLRWIWGLTAWLIRHRNEYDLLHACDFDTVCSALLCKGLFDKKVVYDIFDFYADHLRATPAWVKRAIRNMDFLAIGWADAVILVDEVRKRQVAGSQPRKLAVVYNSPRDVYGQIGKRTPSNDQDFTLVYVGLLQVERGLLELIEVLSWNPSWSLEMAGFGGDQSLILEKAGQIKNVNWHGRIRYQKALELTARCDVSIATYDPSIPNHRYASPNKIYEAMMLGKPIIVARHTNMDRIVEEWRCGLVIDYGQPLELQNALRRLATKSELKRKLGENARNAYETRYAWSKMQDRLLSLYQDIQDP